MCTRPDYHSVPGSARAFGQAVLTAMFSIGVLLMAVVYAPIGFARNRHPGQLRVAPIAHIDVQVHLEEAKCVAELRRVIRHTLRRTARTWAPSPLPIDRVVVGVGFPAGGRADFYDNYPGGSAAAAAGTTRPFTVVSLGLRDGERELDVAEVAGALAAQVQAVVDDHYQQRTTITAAVPTSAPATRTSTASPPVRASRLTPRTVPTAPAPPGDAMSGLTENGATLAAPTVPGLQELLATVKQGQPLEAAGPSSNGTHP